MFINSRILNLYLILINLYKVEKLFYLLTNFLLYTNKMRCLCFRLYLTLHYIKYNRYVDTYLVSSVLLLILFSMHVLNTTYKHINVINIRNNTILFSNFIS
jgi:hypothetical protein